MSRRTSEESLGELPPPPADRAKGRKGAAAADDTIIDRLQAEAAASEAKDSRVTAAFASVALR